MTRSQQKGVLMSLGLIRATGNEMKDNCHWRPPFDCKTSDHGNSEEAEGEGEEEEKDR